MRWILATISEPRRKEETQPYINIKRLKAEAAEEAETQTIFLLREGEGEEAGFFVSINGKQFPATSVDKVKDIDKMLEEILTGYFQRGLKKTLQNSEQVCIQIFLREQAGDSHERG